MYAHVVIETEEGIQVINNIRTFMLMHLIMDLVNNSSKVIIVKSENKLEKSEVLELVDKLVEKI